MDNSESELNIGYVTKYNSEKGFGFIELDNSENIFFHFSDIIKNKKEGLKIDQIVIFSVIVTERGKRAVKINQDLICDPEFLLKKLSTIKTDYLISKILYSLSDENILLIYDKYIERIDIIDSADSLYEIINFTDKIVNNLKNSKEFKEILVAKSNELIITKSIEDCKFKFLLFEKGYLDTFDETFVINNFDSFSVSQIEKILKCNNQKINFTILGSEIEKICEKAKNDVQEFNRYYDRIKKYLNNDNFIKIDDRIYIKIGNEKYLYIWENCGGENFSQDFFKDYLNSNKKERFVNVKRWFIKGKISIELINETVLHNLEQNKDITTKDNFYILFNQLDLIETSFALRIINMEYHNILEIKLILWLLGKIDYFNFELYILKFPMFSSEEQTIFLKKIFNLAHKNKIELNIEKLEKIISENNIYYKYIDFSIIVVINSLINFSNSNLFLKDNELFELAIKSLSDIHNKLQLSEYFEKCQGRKEFFIFYDSCRGKISETNDFYKIEFTYDAYIIEKVKSLPSRRYEPNGQFWLVPKRYKAELDMFASENSFLYDIEGNKYINNRHLIQYRTGQIPYNIIYCEGIKSDKPDDWTGKEFWWCQHKPCFQNCQTIHTPEQWKQYTILDFLNILNLSFQEKNYFNYICEINRYNRLLKKLYCDNCGNILHPKETSNYAVYRVTRFHCINENCDKTHEEIYLSHCLNGKCYNIIDSRETVKCPNGLWICIACGTCCSYDMFKRRFDKLMLAKGFVGESLTNLVNNKAGHLERAEYFCYNGHRKMIEENVDYFKCEKCDVFYDTSKFNINRTLRDNNQLDNFA